MTDTTTPAPGTSTPTGASNVAEAAALAQTKTAAPVADDAAALAAAEAAAAGKVAPEPKAPADKTLTLPTDTDDKGKNVFEPTGHKNLDASLAFLSKHGYGPDHPAMQEAMNGNFALLRAEMAEKGVAGGDAYIMLAEKAHEELLAKHEAKREADLKDLYAVTGSEESWNEVAKWGKENASPEQTEVIKELLAKGGEHMKLAASWLANAYTKATGGVPETDGAGPGVADTRGAAVVTTDALSPSEYGRAVAKARMEHRDKHTQFEHSAAYQKLTDRRMRWKD